jgi:hypothetical protein
MCLVLNESQNDYQYVAPWGHNRVFTAMGKLFAISPDPLFGFSNIPDI